MRIALFHNAPSGGAKRAIYEWTRRLTTHHVVDVYTLNSADHSFCDIRPHVHHHRVYDFIPRRLFDSPWGRLNNLQRWRDLGKLTDLGRRIAAEIDEGDYDVVFANTCRYTVVPAILPFLQTPAVYYLHEAFGRTCVRQFRRPYLEQKQWRETFDRVDPLIALYTRRLWTIQQRSIYPSVQMLANSRFTQEQMKTAFAVKPPVCRYGVDCESFHPIPDSGKEDFVVSVGELSPRKGFDFLIESLGRMPSTERPALKLACNSIQLAERAHVEALAAKHEVNVQVLTNLNMQELVALYNQARLCIYAPVMEPFGLVPLESMSCGTAVIGVREGGVPESIIHAFTGLLTERDPIAFAQAIRELLANPKLASEYGCNGRSHVLGNWTWEQSTSSLESHLIAHRRL